ncbi:hypothetical protein [Scleromatobacter humisilvae]|uniref:Uncharacterized protein n=1 Tax=Scleromatobacter humisilvae TaxID=2897159 RepID=A0A9X2C2X2_9BURK|nr:hypothetical protein [Scleromatobacter humisilvae]MCK9687319.1 hypothetical protein [Scleromatobacter humisilvae]
MHIQQRNNVRSEAMGVLFHAPGASTEQVARGVKAAEDAFASQKITPQGAALGVHARLMHDLRGFEGPEPPARTYEAAEVFELAEAAAIEAAGVESGKGHLEVTEFGAWDVVMRTHPFFTWVPEGPFIEPSDPAAAARARSEMTGAPRVWS